MARPMVCSDTTRVVTVKTSMPNTQLRTEERCVQYVVVCMSQSNLFVRFPSSIKHAFTSIIDNGLMCELPGARHLNEQS